MYIGIVGCLGVGKTRLTQALEQHLGYRTFYEPVAENPYLDDFYADMQAYSFKHQLFVLTHRFRQHLDIQELRKSGVGVLQDQLIYIDALYAQLAHELGTMDDRDYATYVNHYTTLTQFLHLPEVIIHLRTPVDEIQSRMQERGRESERDVPRDYLERLSNHIEHWTSSMQNSTQVISLDWTSFQPVEDVVRTIEDQLQVQLVLPVVNE